MPFPAPYSAFIRPALLSAVATALLGLAASCTYSHGDPAPACDVPSETITYAGVISPIFEANCRRCHGAAVYATLGGGNDFSSYAAISSYPQGILLGSIKHSPGYDFMPKDGGKISDCDIARIEAWYAKGKPQ
ncbi:c-type cytochrome [Hymenobacter ruber]